MELKIQKEEEELAEWNRTFGREINSWKERVNELLKKGKTEEVCSIFQDQNFMNVYGGVHEFLYMHVITNIYRMEQQNHLSNTIFSHGKSMEELIQYFMESRFLLWRVEFEISEEDNLRFADYILENQVSVCHLLSLIYTTAMKKERAILCVARILLAVERYMDAAVLLKETVQFTQGNKEVARLLHIAVEKINGNRE